MEVIKKLFFKSAMHINDLPTHLIIEILQRVHPFSLNEASLTCKLWKHLIDTHCSRLLNIRCQEFDSERTDFLLATNRFTGIHVAWFSRNESDNALENLHKILSTHGTRVVQLYLNGKFQLNIEAFVKMLKYLPNLEYFLIHGTKLFSNDTLDVPSADDFVELRKLNTLKLCHTNATCFRILKCLRSFNLKFLEINCSLILMESLECIRLFILSQKCLSRLEIECPNFDLEALDGDMAFKLITLWITTSNLHSSDTFLKFMKMQAATVIDLKLEASPNFWPIFKLVFTHFKYLRTLQLKSFPNQSQSKDFFEHLDKNTSIKNLNLNGGRFDEYSVDEFIQHIPNVTELTLIGCYDRRTIQFIAENLKQLVKLTVYDLWNSSIGDGVIFPKLTSLKMFFYDANIDWNKFTKDHGQIVELIIEQMNKRGSDWIEFNPFLETTFKNLNKLEFLQINDYNLFPDKHTFDIIRKNCSRFKLIDLPSYYLERSKDKRIFNIPGLLFSCNSISLDHSHDVQEWWR